MTPSATAASSFDSSCWQLTTRTSRSSHPAPALSISADRQPFSICLTQVAFPPRASRRSGGSGRGAKSKSVKPQPLALMPPKAARAPSRSRTRPVPSISDEGYNVSESTGLVAAVGGHEAAARGAGQRALPRPSSGGSGWQRREYSQPAEGDDDSDDSTAAPAPAPARGRRTSSNERGAPRGGSRAPAAVHRAGSGRTSGRASHPAGAWDDEEPSPGLGPGSARGKAPPRRIEMRGQRAPPPHVGGGGARRSHPPHPARRRPADDDLP